MPDVCQGIEAYGRGLIAYSLGEFVFDPRAGNVVATQFLARRAETMILRCRFGKPGLAGSVLVGHESRVLWHHIRRFHFGYVLSKLKNIRFHHVRMLLGSVRHRLGRPSPTLPR